MAIVSTELGCAGVLLSERGIRYATLFHGTRGACVAELRAHGGVDQHDERAEEIERLLTGYANGEGTSLDDYPVDLPECSPLQERTWLALRTIPRGETRSYGWLTRQLGQPPGAARAIGAAMGANPIPLWLPCHRVVASDGTLHGFGGGLAMKRALLELEGALPKRLV